MFNLHDLILSAYDQVAGGTRRVELEKEGCVVKAYKVGTIVRIDIIKGLSESVYHQGQHGPPDPDSHTE